MIIQDTITITPKKHTIDNLIKRKIPFITLTDGVILQIAINLWNPVKIKRVKCLGAIINAVLHKKFLCICECCNNEFSDEMKFEVYCPICRTKDQKYPKITYGEYEKLVRNISDRQYNKYIHHINPNGYIRGIRDYHLDHIFSIRQCYDMGIHPNVAGSWRNLSLIPFDENLAKGCKYDKHIDPSTGKWQTFIIDPSRPKYVTSTNLHLCWV